MQWKARWLVQCPQVRCYEVSLPSKLLVVLFYYAASEEERSS